MVRYGELLVAESGVHFSSRSRVLTLANEAILISLVRVSGLRM